MNDNNNKMMVSHFDPTPIHSISKKNTIYTTVCNTWNQSSGAGVLKLQKDIFACYLLRPQIHSVSPFTENF